jgi:hypothetical protein
VSMTRRTLWGLCDVTTASKMPEQHEGRPYLAQVIDSVRPDPGYGH